MNLHEEAVGAVFWTVDGMYRARLEMYIPNRNAFECLLFDSKGEPAKTVRYAPNGQPINLNYPNRSSLTLIKPTTH